MRAGDVDADVLVVGGGPVGLMLAGELRLCGVRPLVLERLTEPAGHDRAGALHVRTVEILDCRGELDRFLDGTELARGLPFAGMFGRGLDYRLLDTRHPYSALVPQSRTETLLAERAAGMGVEIRRGHEVVELHQDPDGVAAAVVGPRGRYRVRGRYAVGCDGGRSRTRRLAGIGFPGTAATVSALVGYLTTAERNVPRRWERTANGILVLAFPPEGGIGRVVVVEYDRPRQVDAPPVTPAEINAAVARVRGAPLALTEPVLWLSRFGDASRQADRYRSGRIFLAGDAAHVHFPIGGQGLNTGLHDAVNLGWKLAARIRGWGSEELLDTYHLERHHAGERVLLNTRAQLALMRPDDEHTTPLRTIVEELLGLADVNRYFAEMISGAGIRHPTFAPAEAHARLGDFAGQLSVSTGDGTVHVAELLRSGRGLVLDLADRSAVRDAARGWADRIRVVTGRLVEAPSPDRWTADPAEALLVRPDGHIACVVPGGDDVVGLRTALTRWFGAPTVEASAGEPLGSAYSSRNGRKRKVKFRL
jgi:2-polyprenyl-6-methoxyphenol hydroxylase-like FAD-dependent oxidoreductase